MLYDIQAKKSYPLGMSEHVFTSDESFLLTCGDNGFDGSRQGSVIALPEFREVYNALKAYPEQEKYTDFSCEFDLKNKAIRYTFSRIYNQKTQAFDEVKKVFEYSIATGKSKAIE